MSAPLQHVGAFLAEQLERAGSATFMPSEYRAACWQWSQLVRSTMRLLDTRSPDLAIVLLDTLTKNPKAHAVVRDNGTFRDPTQGDDER